MINLLITPGLDPEAPSRFSQRSPWLWFWSALCSVAGGNNAVGLGVKLDDNYWRGNVDLAFYQIMCPHFLLYLVKQQHQHSFSSAPRICPLSFTLLGFPASFDVLALFVWDCRGYKSQYSPGRIPSNARNWNAHQFNTCLHLWLRLVQVRGRRIVRWRSAHVSFHQRWSRLDLHRQRLYPATQAGFSFTSARELWVVYRQSPFFQSSSLYLRFTAILRNAKSLGI